MGRQRHRLWHSSHLIPLFVLLLTALFGATTSTSAAAEQVTATVETTPVTHSGDAADDAAIWHHPYNPAQSTIIGTDKKGGLAVYDLSGAEIQYVSDGNMNNVDIRSGFPLGNQTVALVTASRRGSNTIALYTVNPATRKLENVAAREITTVGPAYGACMYHSMKTDTFYYIVTTENEGDVEQWELFANNSGTVDAKQVRAFTIGSQAEGCVADDELGQLYIGEEEIGIWKYGAEPDAETTGTLIDTTGSGGHLEADVEGLTIASTGAGIGYLIASSQGDNSYVLYRREGDNAYVKTFQIVAGGGIDGTEDTDGIDVTTANLGPTFSHGMFVAQDGTNDGGNQNFKLVPWERVVGDGNPLPTGTPKPGTPQPTTPPQPTIPSGGSCAETQIATMQAIGDDGNVPQNVLDDNYATRWSHKGVGSWIEADLDSRQSVCAVSIAWYRGGERVNSFAIQVSTDGQTYEQIYADKSSGTTRELEIYKLPITSARSVRIVVNGNTENTWASITELRVSVGQGTGVTPSPVPNPSPTVSPSPGPNPTPGSRPGESGNMWISRAELARLPMSGPAYSQLKRTADGNLGSANISDQDSHHDVNTLAVALVYARTGSASYRAKAADAVMAAIETENGGRTLALGRNLVSYVIAADLIDLKTYDAARDRQFRAWLSGVRHERLDGRTLISTHEQRPNNWGTHAGASRVAADIYLGDTADLERAAKIFKGWLGDRASYAGFTYGDLSWQADPTNPVGINPRGATKDGHVIDGVLPDDMRRGCSFRWPPCHTGYAWGGLEGATVQAELLHRAGYGAWEWQDQALLRAARFLSNLDQEEGGWWAEGDDEWNPWLINHAYGTQFPTTLPAQPGKNMGWTDWTHAPR
jgi:myo-inositol-hexaphosphate 3-phosphohydrolase